TWASGKTKRFRFGIAEVEAATVRRVVDRKRGCRGDLIRCRGAREKRCPKRLIANVGPGRLARAEGAERRSAHFSVADVDGDGYRCRELAFQVGDGGGDGGLKSNWGIRDARVVDHVDCQTGRGIDPQANQCRPRRLKV